MPGLDEEEEDENDAKRCAAAQRANGEIFLYRKQRVKLLFGQAQTAANVFALPEIFGRRRTFNS